MNLLDKKQVAELLKVSVRTIDALRKKGLPFVTVGVQVRFVESDILQWVANQRSQNGN